MKDFSTRSLDISEGKTNEEIKISTEDMDETSISTEDELLPPKTDADISQFQMRRKWETRYGLWIPIIVFFIV